MKIRNPRFDFSKVPRYWAADDPILTHFLNAFHVLIPEGERFFIRSVRPYLDTLPEGALRQRCREFMGQEGWHQAAHRDFWRQLKAQGLPVERFASAYARLSFDIAESRLAPKLGPRRMLAVTAALEHYTAVLSREIFMPEFPADALDPEMDRLHRWHGAEELEHKAVAFDLHRAEGGGYAERALAFGVASAAVLGWSLIGLGWFCAGDRELRAGMKQGFRGSRQMLRARVITRVGGALLAYLKPGFHPDQLPDPQEAFEFLEMRVAA